ncbi:RNA-directed DNA polymerase, eukaryota, partial [Tanacetum coccineum]
ILETEDLKISCDGEVSTVMKQRMTCKPTLLVFDDVEILPRSTVAQAAVEIGCMVLNHQFWYLGVMVGEPMSRRLTLLKSVLGASPLYYMSIFKTPKGVLKEMEAIRSKFFNGADTSERKITWIAWQKALAGSVVGRNGALNAAASDGLRARSRSGFLSGLFQYRRSDAGLSISCIPRIGQSSAAQLVIDGSGFIWRWGISGQRGANFIDDLFSSFTSRSTRWVNASRRINIFVWRARRDCLPTRQNLIRRGVVLESDVCPLCEDSVEESQHVFFQCSIAQCGLFIGFVVGGIWMGRTWRRFRIGKRGFFPFGFPLKQRCCWKVCFMLLGGTSGGSVTGVFLMSPLRDAR